MKKSAKRNIVIMGLVFILTIGTVLSVCPLEAQAADNYYFAGAYRRSQNTGKNSVVYFYMSISLYSSPDGKSVGNMTFYQSSTIDGHEVNHVNDKNCSCILKKIGTNKYKGKCECGTVFILKVKKNKIKLKAKNWDWTGSPKGTYKLVERYIS